MVIMDNIKSALGKWFTAQPAADTEGRAEETIYMLGGGQETHSGELVTPDTALTVSTVFGCTRIIAETLSSIPLNMYQRLLDGGKQPYLQHPLQEILHYQPNPHMTAMSFREASTAHAALWGNAFAEIEYDGSGNITALWPLLPNMMRVTRSGGRLWYVYTLPDGSEKIMPDRQVFHFAGMGFDGVVGKSIVTLARESIGVAKAAETFGGRFFGSGAKPAGVFTHPMALQGKGKKNIKKSLERNIAGISNAHRILILEEGMKWEQISLSNEDSQFLETRTFQVAEIARWFRMPLHKLQELSRATFSNIEHQEIGFVVDVVRPWAVRYEQSVRFNLITPTERRRQIFAEHVIDGLLRGDVESRYKAYSIGKQWGFLSTNDILKMENRNPIPKEEGGDVYLVPLNMQNMKDVVGGTGDGGGDTPLRDLLESHGFGSCCGNRQLETRGLSTRSVATLKAQLKLDGPYFRLLRRTFRGVVSKEANALKAAVEKSWGSRQDPLVEFGNWVETFYLDFDQFVAASSRAAVRSYAEATVALVGPTVAAEEILTPELEEFVEDYATGIGTRYSGFSRAQIAKLIESAPAGDVAELLIARADEWLLKRAEKLAADEVVRQSNAVAREVYRGAGVTRLVWATVGKNCPFCNDLHGRTVGIDGAFFEDGDTLYAEDENGDWQGMKMRGAKFHPPIHRGCDCRILPQQ